MYTGSYMDIFRYDSHWPNFDEQYFRKSLAFHVIREFEAQRGQKKLQKAQVEYTVNFAVAIDSCACSVH
jgi:hypothetical protein